MFIGNLEGLAICIPLDYGRKPMHVREEHANPTQKRTPEKNKTNERQCHYTSK